MSNFSLFNRHPQDDEPATVRVLMVCLGNICRSPTAQGVLRHKVQQAGLQGRVMVDSAGTYAGHAGHPPDARARQRAALRGYDLSGLRARKVSPVDFSRFDLILAMDWGNLKALQEACPARRELHKVRRLVEFIPSTSQYHGVDVVGDPYYGGDEGFERVLDLVEAACDGLVAHLQNRLQKAL